MISVQSLPRLLSGSKYIAFSLWILFCLTSCKTKQAKYRPNESNKPTPDVVVKPKIEDTIPDKPKDTRPKDTKPATPVVHKKTGPQSLVHISLLAPFNAKSYYPGNSPLPKESERFLNFYQGFLMGIKQMESEGLTSYIDVFDTKKNTDTFSEKLENIDADLVDIVVGSYHTTNIKALAAWSKEHEVLAVSPWKSSATVSADNPYFYQVSPTLDMYFETIIDHVDKTHGNAKVVVVSRDIAKEKVQINKLNKIKDTRPGNTTSYESLILPPIIDSLTPELILPSIGNRRTTVFIVPYYKSEDFVQAFLTRLAVASVDQHVVVYGMPQWMDFNSLTIGQLSNLHVRLPLDQYVDVNNSQIKNFNRSYFNQYGMIPTHNEAYKGYDLALFLGRAYRDHGAGLLLEKDGSTDLFSSMNISVDRSVPMSSSGSENYSKINFFENKAIQMCEFKNEGIYRLP